MEEFQSLFDISRMIGNDRFADKSLVQMRVDFCGCD